MLVQNIEIYLTKKFKLKIILKIVINQKIRKIYVANIVVKLFYYNSSTLITI